MLTTPSPFTCASTGHGNVLVTPASSWTTSSPSTASTSRLQSTSPNNGLAACVGVTAGLKVGVRVGGGVDEGMLVGVGDRVGVNVGTAELVGVVVGVLLCVGE